MPHAHGSTPSWLVPVLLLRTAADAARAQQLSLPLLLTINGSLCASLKVSPFVGRAFVFTRPRRGSLSSCGCCLAISRIAWGKARTSKCGQCGAQFIRWPFEASKALRTALALAGSRFQILRPQTVRFSVRRCSRLLLQHLEGHAMSLGWHWSHAKDTVTRQFLGQTAT